jgi:hypothetical protein
MGALVPPPTLALTLMGLSTGTAALALPFGQEIPCLDADVAGLAFHEAPALAAQLTPGTLLSLRREPDNPHDARAVAVFAGDAHLGFIPRRKNEMLSRLLDAGKSFVVRVTGREGEGQKLQLRVRVWLREL